MRTGADSSFARAQPDLAWIFSNEVRVYAARAYLRLRLHALGCSSAAPVFAFLLFLSPFAVLRIRPRHLHSVRRGARCGQPNARWVVGASAAAVSAAAAYCSAPPLLTFFISRSPAYSPTSPAYSPTRCAAGLFACACGRAPALGDGCVHAPVFFAASLFLHCARFLTSLFSHFNSPAYSPTRYAARLRAHWVHLSVLFKALSLTCFRRARPAVSSFLSAPPIRRPRPLTARRGARRGRPLAHAAELERLGWDACTHAFRFSGLMLALRFLTLLRRIITVRLTALLGACHGCTHAECI